MTRITDLGRKRKFNEAQFNDFFDGENKQVGSNEEESKIEPKRKKGKLDPETTSEQQKVDGINQRKKGWGRSEEIKKNAAKSEFRRQSRIQERMSETVCFACRQKGHAAKECPSNKASTKMSTGICYRCGSNKHSLSKCRKPEDPDNPLPFATCFVCQGKGHLASKCSKNEKGIYPNGGSCILCRQTTHLAKDCPLRVRAPPVEALVFNTTADKGPGADEDDFMVFKRKTNELSKQEQKHKGTTSTLKAAPKKIVKF